MASRRLNPFIEILRRERRRQRVSQRAFAPKLGYRRETLARWESGASRPSIYAINDYAKALGFTWKLERR